MGERRRDKELCHADAALRGMHRDIVDEVAVRRTRLIFQQLVQAGGGREVPGVREQIPDNLPIDLGDPTSVRVAGELVGEHSKVFEEVRAVRRALDAVHRIEVAVGQLTHSRYHESAPPNSAAPLVNHSARAAMLLSMIALSTSSFACSNPSIIEQGGRKRIAQMR